MLKKRIIPMLLYAHGRLVKTVGFDLDSARDVGDPAKSVGVYNSQQADEIVLLNIERTGRGWHSLAPLVETVAQGCFTPLTIGIDVRRDPLSDRPVLYSDCGSLIETVTLEAHLDACVAAGAGEVLIQSIDRDGRMNGYDLELLRTVVRSVRVPVIGAGGSGDYDQLRDGFLDGGVAALACASIFHFSDSNPMRAKAHLSNFGLCFKVV
jgi:cyclase